MPKLRTLNLGLTTCDTWLPHGVAFGLVAYSIIVEYRICYQHSSAKRGTSLQYCSSKTNRRLDSGAYSRTPQPRLLGHAQEKWLRCPSKTLGTFLKLHKSNAALLLERKIFSATAIVAFRLDPTRKNAKTLMRHGVICLQDRSRFVPNGRT